LLAMRDKNKHPPGPAPPCPSRRCFRAPTPRGFWASRCTKQQNQTKKKIAWRNVKQADLPGKIFGRGAVLRPKTRPVRSHGNPVRVGPPPPRCESGALRCPRDPFPPKGRTAPPVHPLHSVPDPSSCHTHAEFEFNPAPRPFPPSPHLVYSCPPPMQSSPPLPPFFLPSHSGRNLVVVGCPLPRAGFRPECFRTTHPPWLFFHSCITCGPFLSFKISITRAGAQSNAQPCEQGGFWFPPPF